MTIDNDALVLSGMTFLLGAAVTATVNYLVRKVEKRDNEVERHRALAYTHAVQLSEFVVTESVFARVLEPMRQNLSALANGHPITHVFAIEFVEGVKKMGEGEKSAFVGVLKPLIAMVDSYMQDFQLSPEKLADLPRKAAYQYNVHQIQARRVSVMIGSLIDCIEHRPQHVSYEAVIQAIAAFKAHIKAACEIHASFAAIAGLDESEVKELIDRSRARQLEEVHSNEIDVAILKHVRGQRNDAYFEAVPSSPIA